MLAKRLRKLRKEMGISQQELADRLSISRSTLAQYEVNRRVPEFRTLTSLADFFNVSVDYLIGRDQCTLAANRVDDPMADLPPEARREIEEFTEFVRHKYKVKG